MLRTILLTLWAGALTLQAGAAEFPPIPRRLPPQGIEVPPAERAKLQARVDALQSPLSDVRQDPDVEVYLKAVRYALENDEFYHAREFGWAAALLDEAEARISHLKKGDRPWMDRRGLVVRGYRSRLDDSVQPYGLVVPEKLDLTKPVPVYVWLHGRADKQTDLQFIYQRQNQVGTVAPEDGIVLHPFGRHCNAFKFAGEVDVFEAISAAATKYKLDENRVVLWGFSMGGAGVWHLAAHHPTVWAAASPGAGFAETRRYLSLKPENYPSWYEQKLWGLYDAPEYTRNLFHFPVVAYSGENDKQIQAARVMEEAYADHGRELPHLIGPGMGHKYHPETLKELTAKLSDYAAKGRDLYPKTIALQTRTLRYNRAYWVELLGLEQHWEDSRVDAKVESPASIDVKTKNVAAFRLAWSPEPGKPFQKGALVTVDGQSVALPETLATVELLKQDGQWKLGSLPEDVLRKKPGLQGPIDDVFMDRFLAATPDNPGNGLVDQWVEAELNHFRDRWKRLFRGELPEKPASQVTADDLATCHVILWGTPKSNSLIAKLELPIQWNEDSLTMRGQSVPASNHIPLLIHPNPLNREKYVVLNSGMTFREGHDRTNSLQNPKLPDWALVDVSTPPDENQPGRIVDAGFFDESWRFKATH